MKMQRKAGVNGVKVNWRQLIRVVPPRSFGPLWRKGFFYCLSLYKRKVYK